MPKGTRNWLDRSLFSQGSVNLNMAVMLASVAMDLLHTGEGRMRLTRLISLPYRIFDLSRRET